MHPILFKFGPITVYSYGTIIACAFLLTTYLIIKEARRNPVIKTDQIVDLALFWLVSGVMGARVLHVALNINYYLKDPVQILFINEGGLAFHGGVTAAIGVSILYFARHKLPKWKIGDFIMPYLALGQGIGRLGCFLNGCCYGKPTDFLFAVKFPGHIVTRHPTQLYSVVSLFVIFLILRRMYRDRHFDGRVFSCYLIFYAAFRFAIDFLRGDISAVFLGLTVSQLISAVMLISGIAIYAVRQNLSRR